MEDGGVVDVDVLAFRTASGKLGIDMLSGCRGVLSVGIDIIALTMPIDETSRPTKLPQDLHCLNLKA